MSERTGDGRRRRRGFLATLPITIATAITSAFGGSAPAPARPDAGRRSPNRAAARTEYTVVPGDTIASIAHRFDLRTADLLARNGLSWSSTVVPGQLLELGAPSGSPASRPRPEEIRRHVVVDGDTVVGIADRYGLEPSDVLAANGLGPGSALFPGETVVLPAAGGPADAS